MCASLLASHSRLTRASLWAAACVLTLTSALSSTEKASDDDIQRVERGLRRIADYQIVSVDMGLVDRMKHYQVPGVSIAVINDFKIAWAKGYGVLEAGSGQPVTPETLFHAGSIAKPVAAAAALALVQEGLLTLDENINDRLTSWKVPDNEFTATEKVTLRRLLSHTAGLSDGGNASFAPAEERFTIQQTLDAEPPTDSPPSEAKPVRVTTVPGTKFLYSPGGYGILTLLLEDVAEKPFPEILRKTVFDPIGMVSSTFEQPLPGPIRTRATTEHKDGKKLAGKRRHFPRLAAGGLWSTPSDLARFAVEVMLSRDGRSEKILTQNQVREMLTRQITIPGGGQGLGFWIQGTGRSFVFAHKGGTYGSACSLMAFPETGQGAVIMTNERPGGEKLHLEIGLSIASAYDWPYDLEQELRRARELSGK